MKAKEVKVLTKVITDTVETYYIYDDGELDIKVQMANEDLQPVKTLSNVETDWSIISIKDI